MAERNQALTALSQALKLETEGRAFYLKAAEETLDKKCEATLRSLADDERLHAEMIRRQIHEIERGGAYILPPDLQVPEIDAGQKLFPPDLEAIKSRINVDTNVLEILHVALENEIKSYDLYREATEKTTDPAGKQMYAWLSGAEMTHFNLLMANYQSIASGGGWV